MWSLLMGSGTAKPAAGWPVMDMVWLLPADLCQGAASRVTSAVCGILPQKYVTIKCTIEVKT